jgi:hypothetical protein
VQSGKEILYKTKFINQAFTYHMTEEGGGAEVFRTIEETLARMVRSGKFALNTDFVVTSIGQTLDASRLNLLWRYIFHPNECSAKGIKVILYGSERPSLHSHAEDLLRAETLHRFTVPVSQPVSPASSTPPLSPVADPLGGGGPDYVSLSAPTPGYVAGSGMQCRGVAGFVPVQAYMEDEQGNHLELPWLSAIDGVPGPDVGETGLDYTLRLSNLNTTDFLEEHYDTLQEADRQFTDDRVAALINADRANWTPERTEPRQCDMEQWLRQDSPMHILDPIEAAQEAGKDLYFTDYTGDGQDMDRAHNFIDNLTTESLQQFCEGLDPHG